MDQKQFVISILSFPKNNFTFPLIQKCKYKPKLKYHFMINYMMFQCSLCGLKFTEEKRLKIHFKTHEKKEAKNKKQKKRVIADFEKPDFSQVM